MRTRTLATLLALLLVTGCSGESREFLTNPNAGDDGDGPGGTPTPTGPGPGGPGNPGTPGVPTPRGGGEGGGCGEINTGAYNVTRSQPVKYLFSYYFSAPFTGRMFVRINNYRSGGGHTNQNIQFYAVRDQDGMRVVLKRAGDSCGVLPDTTEINRPLTRYAGEVTLGAGTWAFYATHASRVSCWTDTGSGSGPIDVIDSQFEWCY
jgi:hypothetical protein